MQTEQPTIKMSLEKINKIKFPTFSWPAWGVLLVLFSSGIGFTATTLLFGSPKNVNCSQLFLPLTSASGRLYCAELKADQRTADSLLAAIALVSDLPPDHPLRHQIDTSVEEWATEILKLADEKIQAGKLPEAIAIAKKIPAHLQAYQLVSAKIAQWQKDWAEAEATFKLVEDQLRKNNSIQAFREAVKLTYLDNHYWATTKYEEAVTLITIAKEESTKLDQAYLLVRRGGLENLLNAASQAQQIPKSSYAYTESQKLLTKIEEKLTDVADNLIQRERWQELLAFANKIPLNLNIQADVNLWSQLAKASIAAESGTMEGLNNALVQLQDIPETSSFYDKAKSLVTIWQKEKKDLTHIVKSEELAALGTVASLESAIAEADLVTNDNPRYQQAQNSIQEWTKQISILEDQPILDRAKQLGVSNDPQILQQAIAQASLIGQGRSLYPEAQELIVKWRGNLQKQQDQPILDQADSLANTDNLNEAIETAQQIQSGRSLYRQAQNKINSWQQEIKARQMLEQAQTMALKGDVDSLLQAMKLADQIPNRTMVKSQAIASLNDWSYEVLRWADSQSSSSVSQAITIARKIPSNSAVYGEAREKIASWRNMQRDAQARNTLGQAANIAARGTPDALMQAINLASQVPSGTQVKSESILAINNWSEELLRIAQIQANISLPEAISIAQKIPRSASASAAARNQIDFWEQMLQPSNTLQTGN